MPSMGVFAGTDRGLVRSKNEDAFLFYAPDDEETRQRKGLLAIVADGVGGAGGGDRASQIAVTMIRERYYQSPQTDIALALQESVSAANSAVYEAAQSDPRYLGMATTCTALVISGNMGVIAHVGDSRAYVLRGGDLQQITQDHTLVNTLVGRGLLSPAEAKRHPQKNIIVKALGNLPDVSPDIYHMQVAEQDSLLLCSDGLYDLIPEQDMLSILEECSVQESGNELIELAKKRGGTDNITVVILGLREGDEPLENTRLLKTKTFQTAAKEHKGMSFLLAAFISLLVLGGMLYYLS